MKPARQLARLKFLLALYNFLGSGLASPVSGRPSTRAPPEVALFARDHQSPAPPAPLLTTHSIARGHWPTPPGTPFRRCRGDHSPPVRHNGASEPDSLVRLLPGGSLSAPPIGPRAFGAQSRPAFALPTCGLRRLPRQFGAVYRLLYCGPAHSVLPQRPDPYSSRERLEPLESSAPPRRSPVQTHSRIVVPVVVQPPLWEGRRRFPPPRPSPDLP